MFDHVLTSYVVTIYLAAKEREKAEKAEKLAQQKKAAEASARLPGTPSSAKKGGQKRSGTSTPVRPTDAGQLDLAGLNLNSPEPRSPIVDEPPPKITVSREKVLEEARSALEGKDEKKGVSLVVVGKISLIPK